MLKKIWGIRFTISLFAVFCHFSANAEPREDQTIYLKSTFIGDKKQPLTSHFMRWEKTPSADSLRWEFAPKMSDDTLNVVDKHVMRRMMDVYGQMGLEKSK